MLDFGQWFKKQGLKEEPEKAKPMLPDGVFGGNGLYLAYCNSCGCSYQLLHDPFDEGFDQEMSYCGGSPHCLP